MINHFWNLCRACPSVNIDKQLASEYRSTYRWHEYKRQPQQDVVTRPPVRKGMGRRRYEWIPSLGGVGSGMQESGDGETRVRISQPPPQPSKALVNGAAGGGVDNSQLPAAGQTSHHHQDHQQPRTPRKSKSMGRIHGEGGAGAPPEVGGGEEAAGAPHPDAGGARDARQEARHTAIHTADTATKPWHHGHRRTPSDGVAWRHSKGLEADRIIGGENMLAASDEKVCKRAYKSEYRKKFRPFSQYQYVDGKFHKVKGEESSSGGGGGGEAGNNWYKEVIELRRQAGQYRARHDIGDVWRTVQHRGWGVETASERLAEIYSKQAELWEQVSRRSSLQALSLASATPSRPISKAEKEIENSRRSSPIKHVSTSSRERPSTAPPKPKPQAKKDADKTDGKASKESTPRHHSTATGGRSVSVGPENRSPKRASRPPSSSTAPQTKPERRPRPTSLSTSARRKGTDALPHRPSHDDGSQPKKSSKAKAHDPTASPRKGEDKSKVEKKHISEDDKKDSKDAAKDAAKDAPKDSSKEPVDAVRESGARKSTPEPRFDPEKYEPVVKTPPEPTRVKSPDQMMVKSPDPVNWTVPLDTGKTFTVTHNIPEGESARGTPSSEPRHALESRTRQTPEPTKLSQGSLVGTPVSAITEPKTQAQDKPAAAEDKKPEKSVEFKDVEPKKPESKDSKVAPKAPEAPKEPSKAPEPKSGESEKLGSKMAEKSFEPLKKDSETKKAEPIQPQPASQPAPKQASPMDIGPPTSGAVDPMTMSMFGSLNGMNGKSSGTPSPTKPEATLPSDTPKDSSTDPKVGGGGGVRSVPGTNLRCLDDPSFMFDKPSVGATNSPKPKVLDAPSEPQPTMGGGRVLEAPQASSATKEPEVSPAKPEAPVKPSPVTVLEAAKPKGSPYRVLEAPDSPYYPQAQGVGATQEVPPALVSPTSGRAVTEALDKARARFDSFWGGPKDKDPPSKV